MDDLDKKLIENIFNQIKINDINNFKNDLNLDLLSNQINNLFNELHEFIVLICNRRYLNDNLNNEFKRKRIKLTLSEPVNLIYAEEKKPFTEEVQQLNNNSISNLNNNKDEYYNQNHNNNLNVINSDESFSLNKLSNNLNQSIYLDHEFSNQSLSERINELKNLNKSTSIDKQSINLESYLNCCNVLNDYLYESLNTGKWFKISINLRILYGLITLYYVLIKLYEYELNESDDFNEIIFKLLNKIDYGLIYSPPFLNNLLSKLATLLHDYLIIKNPIKQDYDQIYLTKFSKKENEYQIKKSKEIKRIKLIDYNDFYENYFLKKIPVIIENAIDDWSSIQKWNLNYLINKSAYRLIPIEIGNRYTESDWTQKIITVKEFIDKFIINQDKNKGYCAQYELFERIESLSNDFYIPDYCALTNDDGNQKLNESDDVHINAWFGPKNTISPLHNDPKDNLLSQVFGSKYVRLYSPKIPLENIYVYDSNLLNNTSRVDIDNIDFYKYPNFPKEDYEETILKKGDLLYIPEKYWHYIRSIDLSFSISFWWK